MRPICPAIRYPIGYSNENMFTNVVRVTSNELKQHIYEIELFVLPRHSNHQTFLIK